jgi:hypothetical protein
MGIGLAAFWQIRDALEAGRVELVLPDYEPAGLPLHAVVALAQVAGAHASPDRFSCRAADQRAFVALRKSAATQRDHVCFLQPSQCRSYKFIRLADSLVPEWRVK